MKIIPILALTTIFGFALNEGANAALILAKDAPKAAIVNPGNIISDAGTVTADPGWLAYIVQSNEKPHDNVPEGTEVARISADADNANNVQRANGITRFDLAAIGDGTYALSILMRSNNYKQGNTAESADRNLSFAVRLVAEGGASFNGMQETPWIIVQPLKDDRNGGGGVRNMEWFNLFVSGGVPATDSYSISGVWDVTQALSLSGVDGVSGRLFVEVLDPSTLNYASLDVAQFELTAIPEPTTVAMTGLSLLALGGFHVRQRRRVLAA